MKQSLEGGTALNKAEVVHPETIKTSEGGFENAPLSSFEFTNPGQKIEFITQEVQDEIAGDLTMLENKAGVESLDIAAATEAGKKFEEGVIDARNATYEELGIKAPETSELITPRDKEVVPQEKPEIYELADEVPAPKESIPENVVEKGVVQDIKPNVAAEKTPPPNEISVSRLAESFQKKDQAEIEGLVQPDEIIPPRKGLFKGSVGNFIDASKERVGKVIERITDPSRIKKLDEKTAVFAEKFQTLQIDQKNFETQKQAIESKISLYRNGMKGKTGGDQDRAGEAIIRLRKQQAKIEGQQQKLTSKMESQRAKAGKFETRRTHLADRVSKRFAERITPLEIKIGAMEREVVRIKETLAKVLQAIEGYKNRLADFEQNKELKKIYKNEFKACKKNMKDLEFSRGLLKRRLEHITESLVGVRGKKKKIEVEKDRALNVGKAVRSIIPAKK